MSSEYTLFIFNASSFEDLFMDRIRSSPLFAGEFNNAIALADSKLIRSWAHDVRIIKESCGRFLVEVVAMSAALYQVLSISLEGVDYELMDVDCEATVSLESVFQISF